MTRVVRGLLPDGTAREDSRLPGLPIEHDRRTSPLLSQRLVEMHAMTAERTRGERMKKEAKQVDREMAALQRQ